MTETETDTSITGKRKWRSERHDGKERKKTKEENADEKPEKIEGDESRGERHNHFSFLRRCNASPERCDGEQGFRNCA